MVIDQLVEVDNDHLRAVDRQQIGVPFRWRPRELPDRNDSNREERERGPRTRGGLELAAEKTTARIKGQTNQLLKSFSCFTPLVTCSDGELGASVDQSMD